MTKHTVLSASLLIAFSVMPLVAQESDQAQPVQRRARVMAWHGAGGGFLGVQILALTPELRAHFGVPEDVGILVARVDEGGPAESAGIQVGDIVTAVDGETVDAGTSLSRLIRRKEEGDTVTIELYRNGGLESYPVVIAERERSVVDFAGYRFMPGDFDFTISSEGLHLDAEARDAIRDAMGGLKERFDSDEWQDRLKRFEQLDFSVIQERMEEVEKRLRELERELDESQEREDGALQ